MEYLSEEHFKLLLTKEWLVKIDSEKSTPYLMKFYASTVDMYCCVLITDTKSVWGEVLPSNKFARRWRDCNPQNVPNKLTAEDDDDWRTRILDLLSAAHTLGGIVDLSFDIVDSRYADLAFELGSDTFKWRWETFALGPKVSADIISKHLIMPLISVTHLAFSSADPVGELSEADLEKAVDKVGRTARRTVDTHVKHAISRPRVVTTLRRMTAMFNFLPDPPSILSNAAKPDLVLPAPPLAKSRAALTSLQVQVESRSAFPGTTVKGALHGAVSSSMNEPRPPASTLRGQATDDDSVTEQSEDDYLPPPPSSKGKGKETGDRMSVNPAGPARSSLSRSPTRASPEPLRQRTPDVPSIPNRPSTQRSAEDSSSPLPPPKKVKRVASSSDDDSEAERRRRVAQIKGSGKRGAKQPLKRGGRKF